MSCRYIRTWMGGWWMARASCSVLCVSRQSLVMAPQNAQNPPRIPRVCRIARRFRKIKTSQTPAASRGLYGEAQTHHRKTQAAGSGLRWVARGETNVKQVASGRGRSCVRAFVSAFTVGLSARATHPAGCPASLLVGGPVLLQWMPQWPRLCHDRA